MTHKTPKLDPEELLFTLDQLQQTTEIMARVVNRLKHQLHRIQEAQTVDQPGAQTAAKTAVDSGRRVLH